MKEIPLEVELPIWDSRNSDELDDDKLFVRCPHCQVLFLPSDEIRADKKRLDWLEENRAQVGTNENALMALPFWYHAKGKTIREAIDTARAADKLKKEQE